MSLFGVDIASIVTDAFTGQLKPITITREQQLEYDPVNDLYKNANGNVVQNPEPQTFTSEGIAPSYSSMGGRAQMLEAGLITASEIPIMMLAKPLGTTPVSGDKINIDSQTYTITGIIERDPAGATWIVRAEQ